jgi:hypothetical protein
LIVLRRVESGLYSAWSEGMRRSNSRCLFRCVCLVLGNSLSVLLERYAQYASKKKIRGHAHLEAFWEFKDKDNTSGKANSKADRVRAFDAYTATLSA